MNNIELVNVVNEAIAKLYQLKRTLESEQHQPKRQRVELNQREKQRRRSLSETSSSSVEQESSSVEQESSSVEEEMEIGEIVAIRGPNRNCKWFGKILEKKEDQILIEWQQRMANASYRPWPRGPHYEREWVSIETVF